MTEHIDELQLSSLCNPHCLLTERQMPISLLQPESHCHRLCYKLQTIQFIIAPQGNPFHLPGQWNQTGSELTPVPAVSLQTHPSFPVCSQNSEKSLKYPLKRFSSKLLKVLQTLNFFHYKSSEYLHISLREQIHRTIRDTVPAHSAA